MFMSDFKNPLIHGTIPQNHFIPARRKKTMSRYRSITLSLLVLAALLVSPPAQMVWAQGAPITAVTVAAYPQSYTGPCPAKITFTGKIYVDRYPMTFNYQWQRSDGAKGPLRMMRVPNASTRVLTVIEHWQLGAPGQQKQVWEQLRVRSGNTDITSAPATATINCR